jgi:type I restriction enzyme S subunit
MAAVDERMGVIANAEVRSFSEVCSGYTYFEDGDVLFAKIAPCMQNGKHAIARGLIGGFGFGTTEFHVIRPGTNTTADWIHLFLRQPSVLQAATSTFTGTVGQQRVPASFLETLTVPLPPLAEQRRIAASLREQLASVEQARAAAETQLEAANALPAAELRAVFESDEARAWPVVSLGTAGEIVAGVALGRPLRGAETRMVPYLRVANVKDGHLDLSKLLLTPATATEIEKLRLRYGDLLLTEGGDADKLGRGTSWEAQVAECIHQNHIFRVRFDLSRFDPAFVSAQLGSPYGKRYFLAHAKQTTGIATINQQVLSRFPLMAPPLSEQQRVAAWLGERHARAAELLGAAADQLRAIDKLPAALLRQAFSGEFNSRPDHAAPTADAVDRLVLVALYLVTHLHREKHFGRVKLEKALYLSEAFAGVPLSGHYTRSAAGPLDSCLYQAESVANQEGLFATSELPSGKVRYALGPNATRQMDAAAALLGNRRADMDRLLALLAPLTTRKVEAIATLFAAWNDFLIAGHSPTDMEIVSEVRQNWHPTKQKFAEPTLHALLAWMRTNGLIPRGVGPQTERKQSR